MANDGSTKPETVHRLAAFSDGDAGGNPAGVVLSETMPAPQWMQDTAAEVGYSETLFLCPQGDDWRARYFSPQAEVPFCGHATVAGGAILGQRFGAGTYRLHLNAGEAAVEAIPEGTGWNAALTSPPTRHRDAPPELLAATLDIFSLRGDDLSLDLPTAIAFAGAHHLILPLRERGTLARMAYDFDAALALMTAQDLTTIALLWQERADLFHARNAFPVGGVVEDPATGAAAAAFGGYLRDGRHTPTRRFTIIQGETMGRRSILQVDAEGPDGSGVRVSGSVRPIQGDG